jgi:hypothetical protein
MEESEREWDWGGGRLKNFFIQTFSSNQDTDRSKTYWPAVVFGLAVLLALTVVEALWLSGSVRWIGLAVWTLIFTVLATIGYLKQRNRS